MENFLNYMREVASIGDLIGALGGYVSLYALYVYIKDWMYKKVDLSIGSFVVRKKDYNVQNVTNIVSAQFYEGGTVPDNVRKEIILLTSPKVKNVTTKNADKDEEIPTKQ